LCVSAGVLRGVQVTRNGGPGIVREHMHIEHPTSAANGGTGVDCRGARFIGSVTRHNGGFGVAEGRKPGLRPFGNPWGMSSAWRQTACLCRPEACTDPPAMRASQPGAAFAGESAVGRSREARQPSAL
jgi:hypothetical protein